ncbi:circularly permutated Ras protein 1-like isoform 2-T2 [Pholidichthys leucotaenia]
MEFACGFVYLPPSVTKKNQRPKRSALLPPGHWIRPCRPPPLPPPTNSAKNNSPKSPTPPTEKNKELKKPLKASVVYENSEYHVKAPTTSSTDQLTPPPRKTALLPPHMRPKANSQTSYYCEPHPPQHTTSQMFTHDLPKEEPNLNVQPLDPNYSYTIPESAEREVNLPAEPSIPLSAPPLHSRPIFTHLEPEYVLVLPSSHPSSSSLERSLSSPLPSPLPNNKGSVDKGPLPGNPNVLLVSLGKLISEEKAQPVQGKPTSCTQCDSVLDSCYDNMVHECYFCRPCDLKSSPSTQQSSLNGCQDGLFLLNPDEKPMCANDALLLFCIDISGSMTTTSEVKEGNTTTHRSRLWSVQEAVSRCVQRLSKQQPDRRVGLISFNYQVIICTDGRANTELGNLEDENDEACTLLSSTIFYQALGEYAANHGVTVSLLSIEGTDCRLDELGRLADRTGGNVVIASPHMLHSQFEQIIQNRTIATHCSVMLLLPKSLCMKGEREAGHKATREVGNVNPDKEITFQFGANEQDTAVSPPASGSRVFIQLQVKYRQRNGQMMIKVLTAERYVTDDSLAALSSLSLAIIQLNSSQACAALAVRGRVADAMKEGELQKKLIKRAVKHNCSAEDKQTYQQWIKTMEPIYKNIYSFRKRNSVTSDSQPLTDAGAALLYTMKHCNRKSILLKNKHKD